MINSFILFNFKMKIAAIITARHKSKRLPKKHMLMAILMIKLVRRLQQSNNKFSIILCTSKDKSMTISTYLKN